MKKSIYALMHAVTAVFLLLAGCDTMTGPEPGQSADGKATVSLSIEGTGARTVLPTGAALNDVKAWELRGAKNGGTQTPLTELFTDPASQTLYLETGDWDFTLKGYSDPDGNTLILEGPITKQPITLEGPNVLEFTVAPVLEGIGTVTITIELPVDHGIDQAKVFKDSEELDPIAPVSNSVVYTKTDHEAGDYYYRFLLYKDEDLYGTVSELVQVRANLTCKKTYTLEKEDLNIRYAITYEMDGGGFAEDKDSYHYYQYTDADFTLPTPTREGGWTFLRWYVENPDTAVAAIPANSTGAKTFWAKWHQDGTSLASTADIRDYLINSADGSSAENPITLPPVNISLADGGWAALLSAIKDAGKYAALDLSACTMDSMTSTPGEFDPGTVDTGESKIVFLVLPDAATSVKAGSYNVSTFRYFTALKSVTGNYVETIGGYAFYTFPALETVSLPNATTIKYNAFSSCNALKTVAIPKAITIEDNAFKNCKALKTVDLSEAEVTSIDGWAAFEGCSALEAVTSLATSIGDFVFSYCTALKKVDLPNAITIGDSAFQGCDALKEISLPSAASISGNVFRNTGTTALTVTLGLAAPTIGGSFTGVTSTKEVTVKVPVSGIANYDDTWKNSFTGGNTNITLKIETYVP